MPIRIRCDCGRVVDWPDTSAGQTVECPGCRAQVTLPAWAPATPPPRWVAGAPAAVPGPTPPPRVVPPPPPAAPWVVQRPSKGLAVASMVLGIVSCGSCFLFACFPFSFAGVICGLLGVVLGCVSLAKKRPGKGFSIAGVSTGAVGTVLSLAPLGLFGAMAGMTRWGPRGAPVTPMATARKPAEPAPRVLTASEIRAALTGPMSLPRDGRRADEELRKALAAFDRRETSPLLRYECVQNFRRHLACAGKAKLDDPDRQKAFETAAGELVDAVLAKYAEAGEHQQDGRWEEAIAACRKLMELVPERDSPVRGNVQEHLAYCRRRMTVDLEEWSVE